MAKSASTNYAWAGFFLRGIIGLLPLYLLLLTIEETEAFQSAARDNPYQVLRWLSLKDFEEKERPIDVLILGNSHAYTTVDPQNLSNELGLTSFILAGNGTNWMDNYWQLREFLDHFDPKLVMIETWGFNATRVVNYSPRIRVNQMRSLEAHCDGFDHYLLRSVPWLLTPKDWGAVGFQTIKNHQWIWTKPEVIRNNVANKGKNGVELNSLYLGRWVRFTSGMEASTLAGYPHLDKAPHDGIRRAKTSNLNLLAASWIKDLCDERGIKLLAFRAPMYHLHMKNDAYFHQYLDSIFHSKDIPFLDMQQDELLPYNPAYFENTLKASQHMTLLGSMKCAERLVPHINEMLGDCPRRFDDPKWRAMMSETNGFYRLNQAVQGDEGVTIIAEDLSGQGIHIEQAVVIGSRRDDADHSILQVVCDAWPKEANTSRAKTLWSYKDQSGAVQQAWVEMTADTLHSRPNRLVLNASIKQVEILKLNNLIWGQ